MEIDTAKMKQPKMKLARWMLIFLILLLLFEECGSPPSNKESIAPPSKHVTK